MSELSFSGRKKTLNYSMKSQIASMLKNVIDDEQPEEEIQNSIFDQEYEDKVEDNAETQSNSEVSYIGFSRAQIEKSQTTKMESPLKFSGERAKEIFMDSSEISRNTAKKFQTTSIQSNPFIQKDQQNIFGISQMNQLCFNQNTISPFGLGYQMMPMNSFNPPTYNYCNNINGIHPQKQKKQMKKVTFSEEYYIPELELLLSSNSKLDLDTYSKLKGSFIKLSKNQQSSRLCQMYLESTPSEVVHLIFEELKDQISHLLLDPYSNYFCLKLFYFLNLNDRLLFIKNTVDLFDVLSVNKIATYPIQCIIENLSSQEEKSLIAKASYKYLMKLALDVYGTHVLEKIISCFDYELIRPISLFIMDNFFFLSNSSNGLCVIKKIILLEYKQENFERLRKELIKNALILIQNPYGNYALQTAIDNWDIFYTEEIMMQFIGKCSLLSIQKFSSNVIERCIEKCDKFLSVFIKEIYLNPCTMTVLLNNNYGNYVIQTALKTPNINNKMLLINAIQSTFEKLNDKKVICKWRNIISGHINYCSQMSN